MTRFLANSHSILAGRALLLLGALFLAAGPFILDPRQMQLATEFMLLLVLAMMWNLLAGYADIVSVGQKIQVEIGEIDDRGKLSLVPVVEDQGSAEVDAPATDDAEETAESSEE